MGELLDPCISFLKQEDINISYDVVRPMRAVADSQSGWFVRRRMLSMIERMHVIKNMKIAREKERERRWKCRKCQPSLIT